MIKKRIVKTAAGRQAFCLLLFLQLVHPTAAGAEEIAQAENARIQLTGGLAVFQPHSLIGKWNGYVKRFGRHPKLDITHCQDGQIAGTYKGIFGTFPVTGQYDEATGDITIHVNFSSSRLTRIKRLRSGSGIIEANIQNGVLVGKATISDLGNKSVRWEAVKESDEIVSKAEADESAK